MPCLRRSALGREGKFVLKYFLLRKAIPSRRLPKATQFLIVICDSMLVGAIVQSSFDTSCDRTHRSSGM